MPPEILILDEATVSVGGNAVFESRNGKTITIAKNCVIEDGAVIIADSADCWISDSYISSNVRIRNSRIQNVFAYRGSQILETNISIDSSIAADSEDYLVTLRPGSSWKEGNFAFSRGAVIKRIVDFRVGRSIDIPTGHSLICAEELEKIKSRNNRRIKIFREIEGEYFIVNAQYSHVEAYEQFYDPERFDRYDYLANAGLSIPKSCTDEAVIDLRKINKAEMIEDKASKQAIGDILASSASMRKIAFIDSENGIAIVERSNGPGSSLN